MSTMICPYCGQEHRQGAKFCPTTGKLISVGQSPVTPPIPGVAAAAEYEVPAGLTGKLPPNSFLRGRYLILRKVGQGGMAAVYQATDVTLPAGSLWAIKEMSDAALSASDRAYAVNSFLQEANLLRMLNHPNLPKVVDVFDEGGKHYLVMEFIQGQTLQNMLDGRRQPFTEAEILNWAWQLCDVLVYLHSQEPKIVFRDLKPSNIMLTSEGQIKLIDFGIVRFFKPGKTRDTLALGTPGYSAPEAAGGQTDERSDLYSLCVTLHQLLTLNDPVRTMFRMPPIRQINAAVSPDLACILEKGLQNQRDQRWSNVNQLRGELARLMRIAPAPSWTPSGTAVVTPGLGRSTPAQGIGVPAQMAASQAPAGPMARTVAGPVQTVVAPSLPGAAQQPVSKTSRPTTRLLMAAVQLSGRQVALIGFGLIVALVLGVIFLAPVFDDLLPPEFWNNLPIMAIFGALGYAAYPKRGMAFISHTLLSSILVVAIWLRLGNQGYTWVGLVLGALVSGAFMEIWVAFLPRVKGDRGQEGWLREAAWLAAMAMVGTVLFMGLVTNWATGMHLEQWFVSAVLGCIGWFLGDMLQQYLLYRKTGLRRIN